MAEKACSKQYLDYLNEQGYRASIDGDGDVVFKREGKIFCVIPIDTDPMYFRLTYPNFWSIDSDAEMKAGLEAANYANSAIKAAKVTIMPNKNTWASIEAFMVRPDDFKGILDRSIDALSAISRRYGDKVRELMGATGTAAAAGTVPAAGTAEKTTP